MITEALRLYHPVWILPRRAAVDVELGGYRLPAGSVIVFSPYALNRDPRVHSDPERFNPGRWAAAYTRPAEAQAQAEAPEAAREDARAAQAGTGAAPSRPARRT